MVRDDLQTVMKGLKTDGVYGGALLQFVMSLPEERTTLEWSRDES
jgi:hypothetical protein